MKKLRLTKGIASLLIAALVLALTPIGANAEWRQDKFGNFWYSEGSSWATGWKSIDGKWYYFDERGYMKFNTTVDGYYLDSSGAWSTNLLDEQGRYKEGTIVTLSGTLQKVDWTHPGNGTQCPYYVLKLDTPAGFNVFVNGGKSINDNLKEIQVIGNYKNGYSNADALDAKVNKHVTLKGEIWGGAGNWYYHRSATMTWLEDK